DRYFSSDDGLMTLAMGTRGPGFCKPEVVKHDWELAREVGAPISVHVGMGPWAGRFGMVSQLNEMGLLGPDTTYIHCNYLSDDEFRLGADTGGKVSIAPSVEMSMGQGTPPVARALAHGLRPSLSIDVVTTVPGDMFTQMRFLFASARLVEHEAAFAAGNAEEPTLLTSRDVLEFATIEGARVCGLENRTGSLTPGQAGRPRRPPLRPLDPPPGDRPGLDRRPSGRHEERRGGDGRRDVPQARRPARRRRPSRRPRRGRRLARPPPAAHDDPAALGPERRRAGLGAL